MVCARTSRSPAGRDPRRRGRGRVGVDPSEDPWRVERTVWPLLAVMDESAGEPWCARLTSFLRAGSNDPVGQGRRFAAAGHLADLFADYGSNRPAMLQAWAAGEDTDALDGPLPDDLCWQAELWRRLRARVGQPSPAERLGPACDALRAEPTLAALPERVSLSAHPAAARAACRARRARDRPPGVPVVAAPVGRSVGARPPAGVPCAVAVAVAVAPPRGPDRRASACPVVAPLGRDVRELQRVLAEPGVPVDDRHLPLTAESGTLLARVQQDVRRDRVPAGASPAGSRDARPLLADNDASLRVHACHGRVRQVEVLRDVLLGLLADNPAIEPLDVIVMCPDVEAFAPLITAAFGLAVQRFRSSIGAIRWRPKSSIRKVPLLLLSWSGASLTLVIGIVVDLQVLHPELAAGHQRGPPDLDPASVVVVVAEQARRALLDRLVVGEVEQLDELPLDADAPGGSRRSSRSSG